jgi:ribose 5-phosphate isomerase A
MPPSHLPSPPLPSSPHSPALNQDSQKLLCAQHAASLVKSSTVLGLGTGSTASLFLQQLSRLLSTTSIHSIVGVPTSLKTEVLAKELNIPLTNLGSHPFIDLSVDGADEVDEELNLVKGRGGSLLREKMVEGASKEFVVIVDESKLVPRLGMTGPIPVEVVRFGWEYTIMKIKEVFEGEIGFDAKLRTVWDEKEGKDVPFVTDNGNYIVNLLFEKGIHGDLGTINDQMLRITGVMEHGIFIGMATSVVVAKKDGSIMILNKQ